jgi:hypothetical protein
MSFLVSADMFACWFKRLSENHPEPSLSTALSKFSEVVVIVWFRQRATHLGGLSIMIMVVVLPIYMLAIAIIPSFTWGSRPK